MMFLAVNPMHASTVTAFIVHQNEAFGTSFADVSKDVVFTAENVDVAVTLIKMVEVSALETRCFVLGGSFASDKAGF